MSLRSKLNSSYRRSRSKQFLAFFITFIKLNVWQSKYTTRTCHYVTVRAFCD